MLTRILLCFQYGNLNGPHRVADAVVTLLSDFKDGLVVGLIAWGLTALFNWWRWKRAIEAYGKYVTDNAKQAGIEPFDFLNAVHYRRGKEMLTALYRKNR